MERRTDQRATGAGRTATVLTATVLAAAGAAAGQAGPAAGVRDRVVHRTVVSVTPFAGAGYAVVASVVAQNLARFDACYSRAVVQPPDRPLTGWFNLGVEIRPSGEVVRAWTANAAPGGSEAVAACFARVFPALRFNTVPAPGMTVFVPFRLDDQFVIESTPER